MFEDRGTSTEDDIELNETEGENVSRSTISVHSAISRGTGMASANSSSVKGCQNNGGLERLQQCEKCKEANLHKSVNLIPAPDTIACSHLNGDDSHETKSCHACTKEGETAGDARRARVAPLIIGDSISADSLRASWLSVHSEVCDVSAKLIGDNTNAKTDDTAAKGTSQNVSEPYEYEANNHASSLAPASPDGSPKVSASTTSIKSAKARQQRRILKNTVSPVASGRALSLVSLRSHQLHGVTRTIAVDNVTSAKTHTVHRAVVDKFELAIPAVSEKFSESWQVTETGAVVSAPGLETCPMSPEFSNSKGAEISLCGENVGRSAVNTDCNGKCEMRSSSLSLQSEESSSCSSVIVSKPPKPVALNKANQCVDKTGCTSGDFIWFLVKFLPFYHILKSISRCSSTSQELIQLAVFEYEIGTLIL